NGGFGEAPKFPQIPALLFLAEYARLAPDAWVAMQVRRAVEAMVRGGIYDQAGGGICRYTVDETWLVPHFEKMLYDQALLLRALAAAAADGKDTAEFAHVARQTAEFLAREMRLRGGAYASALSADMGGVEGATYVWTHEELADVLSADQLELAERHLGVTPEGDWEECANILTRREGRAEDADAVDAVLARLLEARAKRPQPDLDDKALVSWNAMLARGLMEAGAAFGDDGLAAQGRDLLGVLLEATGGGADVPHVLDDPDTASVRLIEDHAHLAAACLAAHRATGDAGALGTASRLHARTLELFLDGDALYMTPAETDLPVRPREQNDNPTPSGAATATENALALSRLTGDASHRELAAALLRRWWAIADCAPAFAGTALSAMADMLKGGG
ncbi:MAG: hypothetical protein C0418_05595, partial [Coriobacteriaceae bacterium]|nr:hypothetical protein [Coriobacteriaceae bacterium]